MHATPNWQLRQPWQQWQLATGNRQSRVTDERVVGGATWGRSYWTRWAQQQSENLHLIYWCNNNSCNNSRSGSNNRQRQGNFCSQCRVAMAPKCMQRKLLNARLICIRQALSIASFWLRFPLGAARVASKGGGVWLCRIGCSVSDLLATKLFHLPIKMYETARRKFKHFIAFFVTPLLHHTTCPTSRIPIPWPTCRMAHYCASLARLHICFPCSHSLIVNVCCLARVSFQVCPSLLPWLLLMLLLLSMSSLPEWHVEVGRCSKWVQVSPLIYYI